MSDNAARDTVYGDDLSDEALDRGDAGKFLCGAASGNTRCLLERA